jgi:hypothetical protein
MYWLVVWVYYRYCARRWQYTKFGMHHMAAVQGIIWMAEGFKWDTAKTGTIALLSTFVSLPLHGVTDLHGLLSQVKPGNGGIIAQGWINFSILECCLGKNITLCMNCWSIFEIDGMKNIRYNNSSQRDAFYIPEEAFQVSNPLNWQILYYFLSLHHIILSCDYHPVKE